MRRKWTKLILILVALALMFAGCKGGAIGGGASQGGAAAAAPGDRNIVIGVLAPTSGSEAYYGKDMFQAYQLAVDEINAAGGVLGRKLELYQADDG